LHTRSLIIGFFRMLNFFFIECELVSRWIMGFFFLVVSSKGV
jgi:hypothetical protein